MSMVKLKQICKKNKKFNFINKICAKLIFYMEQSSPYDESKWHDAKLTTAERTILRTTGEIAYCQPISLAIPSFELLPLSSTITITLFAVGVMKTIIITR
jgi:hypothetical protein